MTHWVIRQKATGFLFPLTGRKGATWIKFTGEGLPRLFRRPQDARCSLGWWLCGTTSMEKGPDTWMGDGEWDLVTRKRPERNPDDYEILEVRLSPVKRKDSR